MAGGAGVISMQMPLALCRDEYREQGVWTSQPPASGVSAKLTQRVSYLQELRHLSVSVGGTPEADTEVSKWESQTWSTRHQDESMLAHYLQPAKYIHKRSRKLQGGWGGGSIPQRSRLGTTSVWRMQDVCHSAVCIVSSEGT